MDENLSKLGTATINRAKESWLVLFSFRLTTAFLTWNNEKACHGQ